MSSHGANGGGAPVPRDPALELLPAAAAVFDASLRLVRANGRFVELCGDGACTEGAPLIGLLAPAPEAGIAALAQSAQTAACSFLAHSFAGAVLEVSAARGGGELVGVVVRPLEAAPPPVDAARISAAVADDAEDALLALSRELILAGTETAMVDAIARCVRQIFPQSYFCVRMVEAGSAALRQVYAEGPLRPGASEVVALRRGAAEKAQLDLAQPACAHLVLTDDEPRLFVGTGAGFATPLVAAGQFFGVVNLEFPAACARRGGDRDEKLLIQLANQAAVGIRNARLIDELTLVKRQLEEVLENANALILVLDATRAVRVFNRALEQLTGLSRAQVIGRDVLAFVAEPRDRVERFFEASLRGESVSNREVRLRLVSGAELRVALSTAAVPGPHGTIEAIIAIGQDLTHQREFERRVLQAEKLASLGQLAAGVVHEINNPLTTITMYAEALLQMAPLRHSEPGDVEKLRRIQESAERVLKFGRDLTSYARPAQDKPQLLDVHHLLDQAARYCEHAFKQSRATLAREYAQGLPPLRGVRSNFVQVFVNLLTNACHAMPEAGGEVTISTRAKDHGLEVAIADTGTGIDPAHLLHIFDPFFTTKGEGRGTGLGLTIVQGIVEKHGGHVAVRSELGRGTTFTLYLPSNAAHA